MKSTPDLLGNFRTILPQGEDLRNYFLRQKPKEAVNLEEVIKESMIEASWTEDKIKQEMQAIDDAADALLKEASQDMLDADDHEAD
jgi:hypothetical protein